MIKQANFKTSLVEIDGVFFKLEYENPTGSVKDRSIPIQIDHLSSLGMKRAVISSSGNAAISALHFCQKKGVDLDIFVSKKIKKSKLEILKNGNARIHFSKRPVSEAFKFSQDYGAYNLRQSRDEYAANAYSIIAEEFYWQKQDIDAIFIPVSSGTIFVGIGRWLRRKGEMPSLHAVQTEAICPLASQFDRDFKKQNKSLADAIVARYTPRENEIIEYIKSSKGSGWVISDKEILTGHDYLSQHGVLCSYEGGLVLAALWKAKKRGMKYKNPVCLLTGKYYD